MAKWIKLPEGAQVTLSSGEYEATQGMGLKDKVIITAVIIGGLFLFGHCHNDSAATNKPQPHTTTSAPERVDHG